MTLAILSLLIYYTILCLSSRSASAIRGPQSAELRCLKHHDERAKGAICALYFSNHAHVLDKHQYDLRVHAKSLDGVSCTHHPDDTLFPFTEVRAPAANPSMFPTEMDAISLQVLEPALSDSTVLRDTPPYDAVA